MKRKKKNWKKKKTNNNKVRPLILVFKLIIFLLYLNTVIACNDEYVCPAYKEYYELEAQKKEAAKKEKQNKKNKKGQE